MNMLIALLFTTACAGIAGAEIRFFGIGDWGDPRPAGGSRSVSDLMEELAAQDAYHLIISTGDNFYPAGVSSAVDDRFNQSWRDVYDGESLQKLNWYLVVGNHDHGGGAGQQYYQVEFTEIDFEQRWKLPNLWHSFTEQQQDASVKFVMMDTESFRKDEEARQAQLAFIETEFASNDADFLILVGHHAVYSAGLHGPLGPSAINEYLEPLLYKYQVDMYICGHDHNLQYIYFNESSTHFVVAGGGGAARYPKFQANEQVLRDEYGLTNEFYFDWGFASFEVTSEKLTTKFYSTINGTEILYSHDKMKTKK